MDEKKRFFILDLMVSPLTATELTPAQRIVQTSELSTLTDQVKAHDQVSMPQNSPTCYDCQKKGHTLIKCPLNPM